jgi:hypothetical protein
MNVAFSLSGSSLAWGFGDLCDAVNRNRSIKPEASPEEAGLPAKFIKSPDSYAQAMRA